MNNVLSQLEGMQKISAAPQNSLQILAYTVQEWANRAMETIELIFKTKSAIWVLTEGGEIWNSIPIPHYRTFDQRGNHGKEGAIIAVAKQLRATRIETTIANTVVVDIDGLSAPIRVIGIYRPHHRACNLDDLNSSLVNETLIAGDFNATIEECNSPNTDAKRTILKRWMERNNFLYISSTEYTSKRSDRNIDFFLTNAEIGKAATLEFGTNGRRPVVMKCEQLGYHTVGTFPVRQL